MKHGSILSDYIPQDWAICGHIRNTHSGTGGAERGGHRIFIHKFNRNVCHTIYLCAFVFLWFVFLYFGILQCKQHVFLIISKMFVAIWLQRMGEIESLHVCISLEELGISWWNKTNLTKCNKPNECNKIMTGNSKTTLNIYARTLYILIDWVLNHNGVHRLYEII